MDSISVKAYAKINLHLDVISKAENGYHEVKTVMQTVSLCDDVEVALSNGESNSIYCNVSSVPTDSKNLAWRAAELFFERCNVSKKADIRITKRIPVAAGLAGGSTDAAAVFFALNELCGRPLSSDELFALGARLGADVPFCIAGGTHFADGYGERLHDYPAMPGCYIVVACGKDGVSTPWAYSTLDEKYGNFAEGAYSPRSTDELEVAMKNADIKQVASCIYNVFESAIEPHRPDVTRIKSVMLKHGAENAMMSGSGPSVFGIYTDEKKAKEATAELCNMGIDAFFTEPVCR